LAAQDRAAAAQIHAGDAAPPVPIGRGRRGRRLGEGDGSARPLELVKGHFKTYDATRPLFGKLTGTWWWTSTIRGDPKAGTREHDYAFGPEAPERPDAE